MLDYNELNRIANNFAEMNERAKTSMVGYGQSMADVASLYSKIVEGTKLINKRTKEIEKIEKKRLQNGGRLSQQEQDRLEYLIQTRAEAERLTYEYRVQYEVNKKNLSLSNLMLGALGSMNSGVKRLTKEYNTHSKYWLDQLKAVRNTEKNMGLLLGQTASFRQHMYETSYSVADILMDTKDISEIQSSYSTILGRNTILTEKQFKTMGAMSKVLGITNEQAGELSSTWNNLGGGTDDLLDSVESLTKKSRKLGLNTTTTFKNFEKILQKANLYTFKNGIKGMEQMAKMSAKYKSNIESVSGFADKLFDVEGAIEMSANLQVLGGAWSQIADPMQLMFKARNDLGGLQKDIISAAAGVAKFNSETNQFEISALELHRMRGAAEMTGMSLEELRDQAIAVAREGKIKMEIGGSIKNPEVLEWITNTATLKDGRFIVDINGEQLDVSKLTNRQGEIKKLLEDNRDLEKLAKDAMTFDQKYEALVNKLKLAFLPLIESINGPIGGMLDELTTWLNKNKNEVVSTMKTLADAVKNVAIFVKDHPIISGLGLLFGKSILSLPMWLANGRALAQGFNMASNLNGQNLGGVGLKGDLRRGAFGSERNWGKIGRGTGAGALAGLAGMGLSMGGDYLVDSGKIEKGGNAHKAIDYGATALEYGGIGAMIGSMIAPGIGTAIGAAIGAGGGMAYKYFNEGGNNANMAHDFISRPNGETIKFNSADTLVGLKKDGGLGRALLSNAGIGSSQNGPGGSITFNNALEVKGTISVTTPNGSSNINVDDPIIRREITRMVQEQLSANLAGGIRTNGKI